MKRYVLPLFLALNLAACGGDDDEEPAPVVEYASLEVDAMTDTDDGTISLTGASCSLDPETKVFTGTFSGTTGSALELRITGFRSEESTYNCAQTASNQEGDLGDRFEVCAVTFSTATERGINTYTMYRSDSSMGQFAYEDSCSITASREEGRVSGKISCNNLIQTVLTGTPRFPIEPSVSASLTGETKFFCDPA